eukprot:GHVS01073975.1.p1 GENE.GHVS01073975.1~~GHVS01073975.1.p1  ORF type:complete len:233 (-),score=48.40 GHVS01073975.1:970-1668(-)
MTSYTSTAVVGEQTLTTEYPATASPMNISSSSSSSSCSSCSSVCLSSQYRTYLDVFLSDRYRHLRLRPQTIGLDVGVLETATPTTHSMFLVSPAAVEKFFTEGCLCKSIVMGVGGGGLGVLFGSFFFAMKPMDVDTTLPFKQQIKESYKGFGKEVKSTAKSFAKLSFIYSLIECFIERERACHDITNAVYAGCGTGALLAYKAGPVGMAGGCAMFAAFSAAMEHFQPFGGHD